MRKLLADIRSDCAEIKPIQALADATGRIAAWMLEDAGVDDRLAGSYAFMTMLSVLVAGWLMAHQGRIAADQAGAAGRSAFLRSKQVVVRYYLEQLVPEAAGLAAQAMAGAGILYELTDDELAA